MIDSGRTRPAPTVRYLMHRYGPSEVAGTLTAVTVAVLVHHATGNAFGAAVAASWCELVGYYAMAGARELRRQARSHVLRGVSARPVVLAWRSIRGMLLEFGPAELVDTLAVRPAMLFLVPKFVGSFVPGLVLGKLLADVVFYSVTALAFRARARLLGDTDVPDPMRSAA